MFLDDSACNLASFNLMKFVDAKGSFDVDRLPQGRGCRDFGAGIHRRQRQLPDREDRGQQPRTTGRSAWATPTSARC